MSTKLLTTPTWLGLVAAATFAAACAADCTAPALAQTQSPEAATPEAVAQMQRLAAFKANGAKAPLAVLPALLAGKASKDVGDAVGLVLEQQGGLEEISPATATFDPPADVKPEAVPALLGEFVRKNPVGSDHALLAQFAVEQRKFTAVRVWIVDREGALVWADTQRPGDADFDRIHPREPMECCLLVTERVRGLLGIAAPKGEHEGRMARLWAEKSALPPKPELDAMTARATELRKLGSAAKVVVFPVCVARELDVAQGAALAKALAGTCVATTTAVKPAFESKPTSNEQLALWTLAKAFRAHLAKSPAEADYALLAEYLMSPDRKQVGAVHFVLCTKQGDWVAVDYQNDHHEEFQRVAPKDAAGCDQLVVKRLANLLR